MVGVVWKRGGNLFMIIFCFAKIGGYSTGARELGLLSTIWLDNGDSDLELELELE
jgi:hypothetical protein